jgi:hypothetical protein
MLALATTACTPSQRGVTGVTLAGPGRPLAVVESCGSPILDVMLMSMDAASGALTPIGRWVAISRTTGARLTLDVTQPGPAWDVDYAPSSLEPGVTYQIVAGVGAEKDDEITRGGDFTLADLDAVTARSDPHWMEGLHSPARESGDLGRPHQGVLLTIATNHRRRPSTRSFLCRIPGPARARHAVVPVSATMQPHSKIRLDQGAPSLTHSESCHSRRTSAQRARPDGARGNQVK